MTENERPAASRARVDIPADMREFNRQLIAEYRSSGGRLTGRMSASSLLLLTTEGARSGVQRTVVLGFGRHEDKLVVIASDNGARSHPAWYQNLLAKPVATVELGADKFKVRAITATGDEREQVAKAVPYLEGQQKLTEREIPLVVLHRVD